MDEELQYEYDMILIPNERNFAENEEMVESAMYYDKHIIDIMEDDERIFVTEPEDLAVHKNNFSETKNTVILDLDETLINAKDDKFYCEEIVRPHANELINFVCNNFNVILWTASMKYHAKYSLKVLDPEKRIKYCICRGKWMEDYGLYYVKDLNLIKFLDIKTIVIIEDTTHCIRNNPLNGIIVKKYNNKNDRDDELQKILNILERLSKKTLAYIPYFLENENSLTYKLFPFSHYEVRN